MKKLTALYLFFVFQTLLANNLDKLWLKSDKVIIKDSSAILKNVKLSKCISREPTWYFSADYAKILKGRALLENLKLNFGPLTIPMFYDSLPLDGSGRSGFLIPKIGLEKNKGSYINLPYFFWFGHQNYAKLSFEHSKKLGNLIEYELITPENTAVYFSKSALGTSYRLRSGNNYHNLKWYVDWSGISNNDLFWLWGKKELGATQGRLESFINVSANTGLGNLILEVFSPVILESLHDDGVEKIYSWRPKVMWDFKKNALEHKLQWASFNKNNSQIKRFAIDDSFSFSLKSLYLKLSTRFVSYFKDQQNLRYMVPWLFLQNDFDSFKTFLRISPHVEQDALPIIDTEYVQQNRFTWLSDQIFTGEDRVSDQKYFGFSYEKNNFLIGFKHILSEKVCLTAPCLLKNSKNNLVLDINTPMGLDLFTILGNDGVSYFVVNYQRSSLNLSYILNDNDLITSQWSLGLSEKVNSSISLNGEFSLLKVNDQFYHRGSLSLIKIYDCWRWQIFANWQQRTGNKSIQEFGVKVQLT